MPRVIPLEERIVYLGIDPGKSGGMVALCGDGVRTQHLSGTLHQLWGWLSEYPKAGFTTHAVLERVGGYVGGNPTPGSAMFNFGACYGHLEMALVAAGIPFDRVTPAVWQRAMGVPPRNGATKAEHKRKLKARAEELFPSVKVTLATADAILLAEFCRRKRTGTL